MSKTHKHGGVPERASARSRGSEMNKALPVKPLKKADEVAQAPTDASKKTPAKGPGASTSKADGKAPMDEAPVVEASGPVPHTLLYTLYIRTATVVV